MPLFSDTTTDIPPTKHWSAATMPQALRSPIWPITDEAAESSESEAASSSDSDSDDQAKQAKCRPRSQGWRPSDDAPTDRAPVLLPQRPSLAITREHKRPWLRHGMPMRMGESHPTLLQNDGLALASCDTAAAGPYGTSRSEDRIRAAQRLFHALGHSARLEHGASVKEAPKRSRISILQSLRLQAQRRHSREVAEAPAHHDNGEISFATNMQGTQHCVIAMENSTFELVVTPPTPRMDKHEWEDGAPITGVRLSSHKMAQTMPPLPSSPQLQPPPFELAPGRAQQLAQRKKRQAQEATAWMTLKESSTTRLRTQATSASADKMRMLTQWNALMAEQVKYQGTKNLVPAFPAHEKDFCRAAGTLTEYSPKYVPPGRRRMNTTRHSTLTSR